jgi:hypothetical protein
VEWECCNGELGFGGNSGFAMILDELSAWRSVRGGGVLDLAFGAEDLFAYDLLIGVNDCKLRAGWSDFLILLCC